VSERDRQTERERVREKERESQIVLSFDEFLSHKNILSKKFVLYILVSKMSSINIA